MKIPLTASVRGKICYALIQPAFASHADAPNLHYMPEKVYKEAGPSSKVFPSDNDLLNKPYIHITTARTIKIKI